MDLAGHENQGSDSGTCTSTTLPSLKYGSPSSLLDARRENLRVLDQAIDARAVLHFKASIEVHSSTIDAPLKAAQHEILRRVVLLHPRFQIGGHFFATH